MSEEYFTEAIKTAQNGARAAERKRIFELLTSLGVMRDSIIGDHWKVLYAEDGAIDITTRQLEGRHK